MGSLGSVCVYCGSASGFDGIYEEAAKRLGQNLAANGITLVYGGGSIGMMGTIAKSCLDNGGHVVGIIPEFLREKEVMLQDVQELIVTKNMHERKKLMFERADGFIALPGGIGTLEELVELLTWAQLGRHNKPVILANIDGFWQPLKQMLSHMLERGFIRPGFEVNLNMYADIDALIPALQKHISQNQQA
ncbi:TIGR00730 family Rossman fold protein [Polycladidibacter stylochi]|uniref:LOG family protein n=1 Tax=Polycladidibacter stylochi TaxID=1807766 RepID=UPI000830A47B|nr:TIGR00730 family Rossman fold protein [Pseudovibrio stylochi]